MEKDDLADLYKALMYCSITRTLYMLSCVGRGLASSKCNNLSSHHECLLWKSSKIHVFGSDLYSTKREIHTKSKLFTHSVFFM